MGTHTATYIGKPYPHKTLLKREKTSNVIFLWTKKCCRFCYLIFYFWNWPKKATPNYFWSHLKGEAIFSRPMDRKVFLKLVVRQLLHSINIIYSSISSIVSENYLAAKTCPTNAFSNRILAAIEAGGGGTIWFWVGSCGHLGCDHLTSGHLSCGHLGCGHLTCGNLGCGHLGIFSQLAHSLSPPTGSYCWPLQIFFAFPPVQGSFT